MLEVVSNTRHDELARGAVERSRLYGLLATVFRREPSQEFLSQLATPEMARALGGVGIHLDALMEGASLTDIVDDLAIEYTRLFLGPGKHISPHESVQLKRGSGVLWGAETPVVREAYRLAGLDIGETEKLIPDHLSVELDFLSILTNDEAEAWANNNAEHAATLLQTQHKFISRHIGKWVAAFCTKVEEQSETSYYPAFATVLKDFLAGEKADIINRYEPAR